MRIIKSISLLRKALHKFRNTHQSIGFVPTMGAFHEGHLSLMRRSRKENDITVVSIFVNPIQFGPKEDFARYPRPIRKDISFAKRENVDIIFYPSVDEMYAMYSKDFLTYVEAPKLSQGLCGKSRPGHFRGVTTVVAKLLNIIGPDHLYLGQKDYQQAVILRQMVTDLNFSVNVTICPTVREVDGLAMSSRNQYLNAPQRKEAGVL